MCPITDKQRHSILFYSISHTTLQHRYTHHVCKNRMPCFLPEYSIETFYHPYNLRPPRSIFQRQWFVPAQHDRVYPRCLGSDSYSPQPGGDGLNTVRETGHTLVSCNNVPQDDDSFERFHTAIVRTIRSIACGLWCRPNKNKNPVTDLVHVVLWNAGVVQVKVQK